MTGLPLTPSQTVGPYLAIGLPWPDGPTVVPEDTPGAITITGRLLDGEGAPIPDGLIETWQADPDGRFDHPDDPRGAPENGTPFRGFGRCPTGGREAPHLDVSVFARGLLNRVVTRIYFPDEAEANAGDPVLSAIIDPARRETLIATADTGDKYRLQFHIHLQGEHETVFFDV